jgi:hypothetical protein
VAPRREVERRPLARREEARVEPRVAVDRHAPVGRVGRGHEAQAALLVGGAEGLLLVARRDARLGGLQPDLEEVHRVGRRGVELAVGHAGARAHALHVARADDRAGAHRVAVLEPALEHIRDDLHVLVAVRAEALLGLHAVFVDHAQRAEAHVRRVVVVGERERVEAVEPAVLGVAARGGGSHCHHVG